MMVFTMCLLSNMAFLGIHVSFQGYSLVCSPFLGASTHLGSGDRITSIYVRHFHGHLEGGPIQPDPYGT